MGSHTRSAWKNSEYRSGTSIGQGRSTGKLTGRKPGQFIQLSPVRHVPQTMPPARTAVKPATPTEEKSGSYLTIELQTRTGTAMRIQGVLTPAHLRELIAAGNVQP
ncbi:MAG: hypothetical protein NC115_00170 [Bacteroidales bacterium]|nr:hypothetical protein [Bacteroidales bacterium]